MTGKLTLFPSFL